jgi:DNA-binding NarL/FixJ family response regulator
MNVQQASIRILTVDDHQLLRAGVGALIANQPDMKLIGEASSGREAIEQFRKLQPDIVLMDLQMPDMNGIDALIAIRSEFTSAKVLVLTTYTGDALAQRALKAGAQAYILKSLVRHDLLEAIRAVHAGSKRITPDVAIQIAQHTADDSVTAREVEVLTLIAAGTSNKGIAARLSVTEETIKMHVSNILAKLGANDRTHAVTLGLKRGIIQL